MIYLPHLKQRSFVIRETERFRFLRQGRRLRSRSPMATSPRSNSRAPRSSACTWHSLTREDLRPERWKNSCIKLCCLIKEKYIQIH